MNLDNYGGRDELRFRQYVETCNVRFHRVLANFRGREFESDTTPIFRCIELARLLKESNLLPRTILTNVHRLANTPGIDQDIVCQLYLTLPWLGVIDDLLDTMTRLFVATQLEGHIEHGNELIPIRNLLAGSIAEINDDTSFYSFYRIYPRSDYQECLRIGLHAFVIYNLVDYHNLMAKQFSYYLMDLEVSEDNAVTTLATYNNSWKAYLYEVLRLMNVAD